MQGLCVHSFCRQVAVCLVFQNSSRISEKRFTKLTTIRFKSLLASLGYPWQSLKIFGRLWVIVGGVWWLVFGKQLITFGYFLKAWGELWPSLKYLWWPSVVFESFCTNFGYLYCSKYVLVLQIIVLMFQISANLFSQSESVIFSSVLLEG